MENSQPEIRAPYCNFLSQVFSNPQTIESVINEYLKIPKIHEFPHLCSSLDEYITFQDQYLRSAQGLDNELDQDLNQQNLNDSPLSVNQIDQGNQNNIDNIDDLLGDVENNQIEPA